MLAHEYLPAPEPGCDSRILLAVVALGIVASYAYSAATGTLQTLELHGKAIPSPGKPTLVH